jgi:hypothetical protein
MRLFLGTIAFLVGGVAIAGQDSRFISNAELEAKLAADQKRWTETQPGKPLPGRLTPEALVRVEKDLERYENDIAEVAFFRVIDARWRAGASRSERFRVLEEAGEAALKAVDAETRRLRGKRFAAIGFTVAPAPARPYEQGHVTLIRKGVFALPDGLVETFDGRATAREARKAYEASPEYRENLRRAQLEAARSQAEAAERLKAHTNKGPGACGPAPILRPESNGAR